MRGTPLYMAPEICRGEKYDAAVDIYSLGIVMYKLLNNGRMPFMPPYPEKVKYQDSEDALEKRMSGVALPPPAMAGDALAGIVLKACAYNAPERYALPIEMKKELQKVLEQMSEAEREQTVSAVADKVGETVKKEETVAQTAAGIESTVGIFPEEEMGSMHAAQEKNEKLDSTIGIFSEESSMRRESEPIRMNLPHGISVARRRKNLMYVSIVVDILLTILFAFGFFQSYIAIAIGAAGMAFIILARFKPYLGSGLLIAAGVIAQTLFAGGMLHFFAAFLYILGVITILIPKEKQTETSFKMSHKNWLTILILSCIGINIIIMIYNLSRFLLSMSFLDIVFALLSVGCYYIIPALLSIKGSLMIKKNNMDGFRMVIVGLLPSSVFLLSILAFEGTDSLIYSINIMNIGHLINTFLLIFVSIMFYKFRKRHNEQRGLI